MATIKVTTKDGTPVNAGDTVTDFRGDTGTFQCFSRFGGTGTPKVVVDGVEYYARVWNLLVVNGGDA